MAQTGSGSFYGKNIMGSRYRKHLKLCCLTFHTSKNKFIICTRNISDASLSGYDCNPVRMGVKFFWLASRFLIQSTHKYYLFAINTDNENVKIFCRLSEFFKSKETRRHLIINFNAHRDNEFHAVYYYLTAIIIRHKFYIMHKYDAMEKCMCVCVCVCLCVVSHFPAEISTRFCKINCPVLPFCSLRWFIASCVLPRNDPLECRHPIPI